MPQDALPSLRVTLSHVPNGKPNLGRHTIAAIQHTEESSVAFAIASSDHLELVDQDLHLLSTLLFSDAFPNTAQRSSLIQAIAVDNSTKRIAAALDDHVAVWHRTSKDTYKVHSTFSTGFTVQCLDFHGDTFIVGGSAVALYRLEDSSGLSVWSNKWSEASSAEIIEAQLSAGGQYVVTRTQNTNNAQVSRVLLEGSAASVVHVCNPWHTTRLRKTYWLDGEKEEVDRATLVTETADGYLRLWKCFPDEPHYFVLWYTLPQKGRGLVPIAYFWISNRDRNCVLSVLEDGSLMLHEVEHLAQSPTYAARSSSTAYNKARLTRQQMLTLRYSVARIHNSRLTILGISKSAGVGLQRLDNALQPELAELQPWKHARIRHRQPIAILAPAEDSSMMLTVGIGSEAILWQARKLHDRTALMRAVAIYRPPEDAVPSRAALSQDGKTAAIVTSDGVLVLRVSARKLVPQKLVLPSFPVTDDILSLNFDNSNDGALFLVTIDSSSTILVWRIDGSSAELLCRASLAHTPTNAVVTPQTASSAARVALINKDGEIGLGSLLLERDKASYHDATVLKGRLSAVSHLCCSTTNYVAIIGTWEGHRQLRIINTQSSLFTTGLEYTYDLGDTDSPLSIAFTNTPEGLPLLLVTLLNRLVIISQRRLDYYQENTMWTPVASNDLNQLSFQIAGAAFTFGGSIAFALENQLHLLSRTYSSPSMSKLKDLRSNVTDLNSTLPNYHPQLLVQCLLSGKHKLVNRILRRLYVSLREAGDNAMARSFKSVSLEEFLSHGTHDPISLSSDSDGVLVRESHLLSEQDAILNAEEARELIQCINEKPLPNLSRPDMAHLAVVIETHIQVDAQRRALDNNGMRFLLSLRSFAITHRSQSPPPTRSPSPIQQENTEMKAKSGQLPQMRWRDVLWAFHSDSQEILLSACNDVCGKPMLWEDAKQFCLPLWLKSSDSLAQQVECIARNEFTRGETRDPNSCSLYYFALRKKRLVQGLWRQATFHKERGAMMKFLMNDFEEPRWRSAAIKNAFALMSKHRFFDAAAFFLLGDSLKDCLGVCLRQLNDWQLAVMLARVYEGDEGPHLKSLLSDHVVPMSFASGYRRLASWAFWMLKRRDLAVRVIVTPFAELLSSIKNPNIKEIGVPGQEDPSLVLLYADLRDWSVQTLRGSWEILPIRETQFITHIAEAFCRMGCHPLALDLVCSWRFTSAHLQLLALSREEGMNGHQPQGSASSNGPTRPGGHHRRRSSMFQPKRRSTIIMDVPSTLPSRSASPVPDDATKGESMQELDIARREGLKKVLKEVKAPPPEFDMSSFGF
ncbi:hypothetical protein P389DRAFT_54320 [Cystobasidium minutum MCA 4210]|uniref:uncharacterized protein n=1 Tax=Cystobasidium minutum MCA 4210 TaxID=1397322 RepID=UPI0034CF3B84|eukprot:jgi/Rhomi1/54320/CE54319_1254